MIRRATLSDSPAIRKLLAEAWKQAHGHIPLCDTRMIKTVQRHLSNPQCVCFLSDVDGVKGLLAASVSPLDIAEGKVATDHVFYCKTGEGRKLIKAYVDWAKEKDAVMINMTVSSKYEPAHKVIKSCGFAQSGGCYFYE